MGKYSREAENTAKSCKSRGSHLRVHFKVNFFKQWKKIFEFIISESWHMTWQSCTTKSCMQCVYSAFMLTSKTDLCDDIAIKSIVIYDYQLEIQLQKFCKSRFSMLLICFFFKIFRTPMKLLRPSKRCHCVVHNVSWKMSSKRKNVFHSVISTVVLVDALKLNNGTPHKDVGQRNPPTFCFNCWKTLNQMPNTKAWTSTDWSLTIFWWVNS